jgi:hypothetical protein
MGFLSEVDLKAYNRYKKMGLLESIDAHLIDLSHGAIEVVCGDCDHQVDIYKHMTHVYHSHKRGQRDLRDVGRFLIDAFTSAREAYKASNKVRDALADACRTLKQRLFSVDRRIHEFKLNGGALLIAAKSPLTHLGEDRVLIEHIRSAMRMKKIQTVVLFAHAPCGMAGMFNLDLKHVLDNLIEAKLRLKSELVGAKVVCFVHIARPDGIRRTYFISAAKWRLLYPRRQEPKPLASSPLSAA